MSRIKYVSVVEDEGGKRTLRAGKSDRSGTWIRIPTPDNGLENMERIEWERVCVFTLPESMPKSKFKDWWNEHKDDEPAPSPIPEVIGVLENNTESNQE